jgi:hypothetical protein
MLWFWPVEWLEDTDASEKSARVRLYTPSTGKRITPRVGSMAA